MIGSDYKMALASIRTARWRSMLTMLGIIIGVSSVVTIASLGEGLKQQIVGQIDQLGSNILTIRSGNVINKSEDGTVTSVNPLALLSTSTLTEQDLESVRKTSGIELAAPMSLITNNAVYEDRQINNAYVVATDPDLNRILGDRVNYGGFFTEEERDQKYAVIGPAIADRLFSDLNPVGQTFSIGDQEFLVRGVNKSAQGGVLSSIGIDLNYAIFIPHLVGKQLTSGQAQIIQIISRVDAHEKLDAAQLELQRSIRTNHKGQENFTVLKQDELLKVSDQIINVATGAFSGIAAISLLVGGIGIMNILLVSVSERTREIGIRKAVGATNRQILNQFLMEGMVLSVSGGVIGVLLAVACNFGLRIYTDIKPVISLPIVLVAVGVTVAIGVIFSAAPAVQAARKNTIDALRNE